MFSLRTKQLTDLLATCLYDVHGEEINEERALETCHRFFLNTKKNAGIIYVIGNGGSAGIASHFCIDLINALNLRAQTLYDSNVMTCVANDYGYDQVFSYPLKCLLKSTDMLVAVSSSGESPNILNAVHVAKQLALPIVTFSGFEASNALRQLGNLNFYLHSFDYGLVETGHFFLLHTIIDAWNPDKVKNPLYSLCAYDK